MKRFCKEETWGVIEHRTREQKRESAWGEGYKHVGTEKWERRAGEKT